MRDRLAEIKKTSGVSSLQTAEVQATAQIASGSPTTDLEKASASSPLLSPNQQKMKQFFDEVSSIRAAITGIKKTVTEIEETHGKALTAVTEDQNADHAQAIDGMMDQITLQSGLVRKRLKEMESANKQFSAEQPESSDTRVRVSQYGLLLKKFTDVMTEYNEVQSKFKNKYKQRLQKQFLTVKPDATAEEVEKVTSGEGGPVFAQQIMPGAQYLEARKALEDIQERHQDIIKIEKSILELQQLFVDMSVLVAQQGDLINQIDHHVAKAVEYTNAGVEEMKSAVKIQKRSRKRMCTLIFCLIILAVIVGLGMLGYPIATTTSAQVIYHHVAALVVSPAPWWPHHHMAGDAEMPPLLPADCTPIDLGVACLFTAGKVEDTPKKMYNVLAAAYALTKNGAELTAQDAERWKSRIVEVEKVILEAIGFNFRTAHPFRLLVKVARKCKVSKDIGRDAWRIAFDSYQTTIPLAYPTYYTAISSLFLACKLTHVEMPPLLHDLVRGHERVVQAFASEMIDMYLDLARDSSSPEVMSLRSVKLELVQSLESPACS
ncbi:hypothetical protein RI367_005140 [Sorochytrium milnesiophthora]